MRIDIEHLKLAERYALGELTGHELSEFNELASGSDDNSKRIFILKQVVEGIHLYDHQQLKEQIQVTLGYKKPVITQPVKIILLFLVLVISIAFLWVYNTNSPPTILENKSWKYKMKNLFQNDQDEHKPALVKKGNEPIDDFKNEKSKEGASAVDVSTKDDLAVSAALVDSVEVKQDILITSKYLTFHTIGTESNDTAYTGNLEMRTIEKLGMEADLVSKPAIQKIIKVEFWQSPINYKGYWLNESKLVLFGIEETDEVQLIKFHEEIYLKYLGSIYRLQAGNLYRSFHSLNEAEIPDEIK